MIPFDIIVIAPETDIPNEITILHQLFEAGLKYYHFRKPEKDYQQHCEYLDQIDSQYHKYIVPHYHHELINEYDLKGLHFQEQKRRDELESESTLADYCKSLSITKSSFTVSSSFHEPKELANCNISFDYHLLSPVFSSISKQGYEGRGFDVNHIDKKIIGMGGVTTENLAQFQQLGFQGVGVLGGIWKSKEPIKDFKKMKDFENQ